MELNGNSWSIIRNQFDLAGYANEESLFTLANGYLGMRGDGCERIFPRAGRPGTFVNGFYEKSTILYGESAYGFARNKQVMLNVCNAKLLEISVDGEVFLPDLSVMEAYRRELDLKHGIEVRTLIWISSSGKKLLIENCNLVSLSRKFTAARECRITPINFTGTVTFRSVLDGQNLSAEQTDDPRLEDGLGDGGFSVEEQRYEQSGQDSLLFMKQSATRSGLSLACAVVETISVETGNYSSVYEADREQQAVVYQVSVRQEEAVSFIKYISYVTGQGQYQSTFEQEAVTQACQARADGFDVLLQEQALFLEQFWQQADIRIKGDERLTRSIRFNMFQLLQSAGRDSVTSIASKGLSGEGYGGHYFWEAEAYIAPVFMFSRPDIARSLLQYRYTILDKAREQARLMGHQKGALYSWRSIDGEESSAYFPAGSAQYHINSDIAFAVCRYLDATQDWDFLADYGLEIILETARIWIDMGHYSAAKQGDFCIDCVTGPDEYTALVNNNCYTNIMAREHLWYAVRYARRMEGERPEAYRIMCKRIGFVPAELKEFSNAADHMHIPYDEELGIHMQDDTFLQKKVFDLAAVPAGNFPLLLHYHPLFIYRHQVCKQPDLLLAQFYLPHRFTADDKKRAYKYYEKLATHDSSLSVCIFSVMAAETGDIEKAYRYFKECIRTDLDDVQGNTKDGLHMANMAGAWMSIINGFAGMRALDGVLYFNPILPKQMEGYEFRVRYRDSELQLSADRAGITYCLMAGPPLLLEHRGDRQILSGDRERHCTWEAD